jgi:hypothetical protein
MGLTNQANRRPAARAKPRMWDVRLSERLAGMMEQHGKRLLARMLSKSD